MAEALTVEHPLDRDRPVVMIPVTEEMIRRERDAGRLDEVFEWVEKVARGHFNVSEGGKVQGGKVHVVQELVACFEEMTRGRHPVSECAFTPLTRYFVYQAVVDRG